MNYLIYLAYGLIDIRSEAIYSILSYDAVRNPESATRILVYTDDATAFQQILGARADVLYPTVTAEQWQAWRGQ